MLEALPSYYHEDPAVIGLVGAYSRELARIDAFLAQLRAAVIASTATAAINGLSLQEVALGLRVNAPVTEAERQASVQAAAGARHASAGLDWEEAVTRVVGNSNWEYTESASTYTVTVLVPFEAGSANAGRVQVAIRKVTPAHLDVVIGFLGGFRVGVSRVGDPL